MSDTADKQLFGHRTVTSAAVENFGNLTGDRARMHFDHDFRVGGERVAHGLLGAAWALGALAEHRPDAVGCGVPDRVVSAAAFRFTKPVVVGETLAFRDASDRPVTHPSVSLDAAARFEVWSPKGEVATRGAALACDWRGGCPFEPPAIWSTESFVPRQQPSVYFAEDLLELGFAGEAPGRTLTEGEAVAFANEVGDPNPLLVDRTFAARSCFGERVVSPMFVFCVAFAGFLKPLLRLPLPDAGFAGHLGDAWRMLAPVAPGDTITTRFRTLACRASQSQPGTSIVTFGLQVGNQRGELVHDGEVAMMFPTRE